MENIRSLQCSESLFSRKCFLIGLRPFYHTSSPLGKANGTICAIRIGGDGTLNDFDVFFVFSHTKDQRVHLRGRSTDLWLAGDEYDIIASTIVERIPYGISTRETRILSGLSNPCMACAAALSFSQWFFATVSLASCTVSRSLCRKQESRRC